MKRTTAEKSYGLANANALRCGECHAWIPCQRGRIKLENHVRDEHPAAWTRCLAVRAQFTPTAAAAAVTGYTAAGSNSPRIAPQRAESPTIKRPDLFGSVIDTYQTETELNGHRATQGKMQL